MTEGQSSKDCGHCGTPVHDKDTFCGVCGAEILPSTQDQAYAQQIAEPSYIPEDDPTNPGNRKRLLAIAVGTLLVLLVGTGAVAYAAFGPSLDLLGW